MIRFSIMLIVVSVEMHRISLKIKNRLWVFFFLFVISKAVGSSRSNRLEIMINMKLSIGEHSLEATLQIGLILGVLNCLIFIIGI